ncbi:hypothetical protein [Halorhodospira halochloris]|nr:hypothetical protein [Halorhodospira halochloris]
MKPSREASWHQPWRHDLHTGATQGSEGVFKDAPWVDCAASNPPN